MNAQVIPLFPSDWADEQARSVIGLIRNPNVSEVTAAQLLADQLRLAHVDGKIVGLEKSEAAFREVVKDIFDVPPPEGDEWQRCVEEDTACT